MPVRTTQASPPIAAEHGCPLAPGRLPTPARSRPSPHSLHGSGPEYWWVLRTIPQHERQVTSALLPLRLSYFSPHVPRPVRSARQILEGQSPLFPGFLFLLATPAALQYLFRLREVTKHLPGGGGSHSSSSWLITVGDRDLPRRHQAAQRHLHAELAAIALTIRDEQRRTASLTQFSAPRPLSPTELARLNATTELDLAGSPIDVLDHQPLPDTTKSTDRITLTVRILGQAVDLTTTPARLLAPAAQTATPLPRTRYR